MLYTIYFAIYFAPSLH